MAHVLVVDDEPGIRTLLSRWLTAEGHQVTQAPDAEAALNSLAASPDTQVVICDVQMPGKGGLWLVDEIRRRHPTLGLLFATGERELPATSTLKEGVVAYILKPFVRDQVLKAVASAAEWNQSARLNPRRPDDDPLGAWLKK